ncbi:hypothetical protein NSND_63136 [Nitrospira sp. ND1]|nr:hypothetical protein NSND_63136 [Nitrospira sp. ND1]
MPGIISPHQTIDQPIDLSHRHIDPHYPLAGPTLRTDKPRGIALTGDALLNTLGMHPSAAPAHKHIGPQLFISARRSYPIFPG